MRLSTLFQYQNNLNSFSRGVSAGNEIYNRLASNKSVLTPSDDPAAAAQAVLLQDALAQIGRFDSARQSARAALELEDHTLGSIGNVLTKNLTEKLVQAGNDGVSDADRAALATELEGIRNSLRDLGNTRDGQGNPIFAGYKTGQAPFDDNGNYRGGDTALSGQVADNVEMALGHTGRELFMSGSADDLLQQLDKAIAALKQPVNDDADRSALRSTLEEVSGSVRKGIDNLGKLQAEVGTRLQQLDALDQSAATQQLDLTARLEQTVGSDYDTLIGLIGQSKMSEFSLNASMMVFQSMQKMSLFNMTR